MRSKLLALSVLAACTGSDAVTPAPPPAAPAPRAAPVVAPLVGVLAARTSNIVAAQIDGRILRIAVSSGQRVRTGDLIAEIDATVIAERLRAAGAAVDAARADSAGSQAEVGEANRQIALERRMFAAGASAEESVRLARASLARAGANAARAEATLREAEATRASLQAEMTHTTVIAPIDGVVSLVKAQPGEVVTPGAILARVFDPGKLMVRFQVTRARRAEVAIGTAVALRVPGVDHDVAAQVTSVSADLEPPLDFAVAEADVTGDAHDVQVGTVGDVRVTK